MHQDPLLVCVIGTVFTTDSSDWRRSETEIDDGKRAQVFVKMATTADGAVDASDGNTERYTFISGDDSPFCQWHPSDFTADGIKYNCAEQFMMHQKAGNCYYCPSANKGLLNVAGVDVNVKLISR